MADDDRPRRPPLDRLPTGPMRRYDPRSESQPAAPASTSDLEGLMKRVLAVTERAPERQREMLDSQAELNAQLVVLQLKLDQMASRLAEVEQEQDKSGEHRLVDLTKERDELKESRRHWVRYVVMTLVGMGVGGLLMALGRLLK